MAVSLRLIRSRVKSVKNTKKITKAMELVSAAKMRKAVAADLASRSYASAARLVVEEVARTLPAGVHHPLLHKNDQAKARSLFLVFSSDKGLCGGFNAQILKTTELEIRRRKDSGEEVDVIAIGKRGASYFKSRANLMAAFSDLSNNPQSRDVLPISSLAVKEFLKGNYRQVVLCYNDFKSAMVQVPTVRVALPLVAEGKHEGEGGAEFLFEPEPQELLNIIVPRLVETLIFQALLESNASEHSARMMNMKTATSSATDMIDDLTFLMNQVRQAGITREISEISAGKAALE